MRTSTRLGDDDAGDEACLDTAAGRVKPLRGVLRPNIPLL
jgi:hypothetical protein